MKTEQNYLDEAFNDEMIKTLHPLPSQFASYQQYYEEEKQNYLDSIFKKKGNPYDPKSMFLNNIAVLIQGNKQREAEKDKQIAFADLVAKRVVELLKEGKE